MKCYDPNGPVVIVTGSRKQRLTLAQEDILIRLLKFLRPSVLFHGGAHGVDASAGAVAEDFCSLPVERFPADWGVGHHAGPMRNREMAERAARCRAGAYCIAFPGHTGTQSMVKESRRSQLSVIDLRPSNASAGQMSFGASLDERTADGDGT